MSGLSISAKLEYDRVSYDKSHVVHAVVFLKGAPSDPGKRKTLAIGAAIDCSGSMGEDMGKKIEGAKASLLKLIDNMTAEDSLGVVGFSQNVWEIFPASKMTAEMKEKARTEVKKLQPLNSTNLSGATLAAFDLVKDHQAQVVRSFLFTDGLPTAGETDRSRLVQIAGKKPNLLGLTAFGYGSNHDPELLQSMAKEGGGNFYYVRTPDEIARFFGIELGGLISCVAQQIKVTLKAAPGVKILEVLDDYDVKAEDDGSQAVVTVDDLYSEEIRPVLFKLELPEKSKAVAVRPSKVLDIKVEFHDLKSGEPRSEETRLDIEYVKPGEEQKDPDQEVLKETLRIKAAEAQEEAERLVRAGDIGGARQYVMAFAAWIGAQGCQGAQGIQGDLMGAVMDNIADVNYLHANRQSYASSRGQTVGSAHLYATSQAKDMGEAFVQDYPVAPHSSFRGPAGVSLTPPVIPAAEAPKGMKTLSKKRKHRR